MSEREAKCPECGSTLSVSIEKNKRTGELKIVFWCEGDYDDKFRFEIMTGLKNSDLDEILLKEGKIIRRQMNLKLIERETKEVDEEEGFFLKCDYCGNATVIESEKGLVCAKCGKPA